MQSGNLRAFSIVIGSDPGRARLVAEAPTVSGVHARLESVDGEAWFLTDLESTNGTFVDGVRIEAGLAHPLQQGARVRLGRRWGFVVDESLLEQARLAQDEGRVLDLQEISSGAQRVPRRTRQAPALSGNTGVSRIPVPEPSRASLSAGAVALSIGYSEDNDVCIPNPLISAYHARIYLDGDAWALEDQGSTNGTWVGGERVHRAPLEPGEVFHLGSVEVVFDAAMKRLLEERRASGHAPSGRVVRIGRSEDNEIVLQERNVSARHAELLEREDGSWFVRDLQSTNGTFLNSRENRIEEAIAGPADTLFLGRIPLPMRRIDALLEGAVHGASRAVWPSGGGGLVVGRSPSCDVVLDDARISSTHARVERLGADRFLVQDLGSMNGTFVNGVRIRGPVEVGADDRVSVSSLGLRLHADEGVSLRQYQGDIILQAERVCVDVEDRRSAGGLKRILHDVSFTAYPTEFVGLMGPSGAGKTTLLLALNGYTPPSRGRSLVNGLDLYGHYDAFRGNIGYVPQDDIVYPQLTVRESLYYTARLRLPADTTGEEIDARIRRILENLEIAQTADVRIGDAVRKGISGGQRKRVNLAQELITEPSLLLLDEPTSGLASEDTINVMRLLRKLSDSGKTILMTIHQPSLEAYRLMDNVLYLAQGNMVYYGPAWPDSIRFMQLREVEPEEEALLLSDPGNALKPLATAQREVMAIGEAEARERALREMIDTRRQAYQDSSYYREYVYERASQQGRDDVEVAAGSKKKTVRRGLLRQLGILSARNARIKWQDRLNLAILMAQAPIIAFVLALVFAGSEGADAYFDGLVRGPAALFLLVASAVWFGCSNAAREIVGEQAVYRRERMVNLMIPSYVASKYVTLGVLCAVQVLVLLGIVWVPLGLTGSFVLHYAMLLLVSLAGLGMGLTLSAFVSSGEAAVALVPLLLIPQIILGGIIMPVQDLSPPMQVLSSAMVARWGLEGMLTIEYGPDDLQAIASACGIPQCSWGFGPSGQGYFPSEGMRESGDRGTSGVVAIRGELVEVIAPTSDADVCQAFCRSVQRGRAVTPIERSFGPDPGDPMRRKAEQDIAVDGGAPAEFVRPGSSTRVGLRFTALILMLLNLFLAGLVCAALKYRDVDVG